MDTPPEGIRWTQRQHYDAALEIQQEGGPWQDALTHAVMGVLAALIQLNDREDRSR